jgi:hypothetical protein
VTTVLLSPEEATLRAERILALFDDVSESARDVIGTSLEMQSAPFLQSLGSALTYSPRLATMVLARALRTAHWEPANLALVDELGNDEPWLTIKDVLSEALGARSEVSHDTG